MTSQELPLDPAAAFVAPAAIDDALVREHWPQLVRLAFVIVGDTEVAKELAQEAFITLQRKWGRVDNPAGFLRTVIANRAKSFTRRRSRERSFTRSEAGIASAPHIDETAMVMMSLPVKYRVVLAMRFYEDLSVDEIARILDRSSGTVKSQIHRGLAQMRAALREEDDD